MSSTIYDQTSIPKLIFTFSLPSIFALIVETLTSVVDTSFAGHLGNQSESALSAMGLLSPLLAVFVALQTLFAISTAIMISRFLGRQDKFSLHRYFQNGFLLTLIISSSTSLLVFLFIKPILLSLGAKGDVYDLAHEYVMIILVSNIFSALGYTLTSSIRAFGYPKMEAFIITLSVVINIASNAVLTFGFHLGMTGIALGTLLSEIVCALLATSFLIKGHLWFKASKIPMKEYGIMTYKMFKIGFAQTAIQLLAGFSAYIVNHQLISIGGNSHVAVWNVANKLYMLALMPIIGMTQAVQTIIAYFDGKKVAQKKKETIRQTVLYCFIYGIGITMIIYVVGKYFLRIFTEDLAILTAAQVISKVIFLTFPLLGITYTIMTLLQVTEREIQAVVLGLTRQVIAVVPLVIMLPFLFSKFDILGIPPAFSIFFSMPIADVLTLFVAIFFFKRTKLM
ncbi:MATE family efflux transporter [Sporosarcina obsidiansis]|uniref:MATE family efflux transporter n=1 Tax=Sporosarcina obsidiansis TaxID=2660748 RepID=UPI001890CA3D|nr:MATE family efflux transporter [Sporosarcina obsidiansis]